MIDNKIHFFFFPPFFFFLPADGLPWASQYLFICSIYSSFVILRGFGKRSMSSLCRFYFAQYEAEKPYLSRMLASTPLLIRSFAISVKPSLAAMCKQVKPFLFYRVGSPPHWRNNSMTSIILCMVALCNGVLKPTSSLS